MTEQQEAGEDGREMAGGDTRDIISYTSESWE